MKPRKSESREEEWERNEEVAPFRPHLVDVLYFAACPHLPQIAIHHIYRAKRKACIQQASSRQMGSCAAIRCVMDPSLPTKLSCTDSKGQAHAPLMSILMRNLACMKSREIWKKYGTEETREQWSSEVSREAKRVETCRAQKSLVWKKYGTEETRE